MDTLTKIGLTPIEIAKFTIEAGYCHIRSGYYFEEERLFDLLHLQQLFYELREDPYGGRKFRSQATYTFQEGVLSLDEHHVYLQDKDDNYQENGRSRLFDPVSPEVLNMQLFKDILKADLEIAGAIGEVDFGQLAEVGVHLIRYAPLPGEPSFSSPRWLHKDTEETVFVHLINLSANANGGENIISHDAKFTTQFEMIRLVNPLDTLLVNRKHFHAVVPLVVGFGNIAYRDVLLITFNNK